MVQSSSASSARTISDYIDLFEQMKKAAGVTEVKDVIERFRTQGETTEVLDTQNNKAKEEVRKLSTEKEELQEKWEKVR